MNPSDTSGCRKTAHGTRCRWRCRAGKEVHQSIEPVCPELDLGAVEAVGNVPDTDAVGQLAEGIFQGAGLEGHGFVVDQNGLGVGVGRVGGRRTGSGSGTLNPGGTATRAQFATILQRFYNAVGSPTTM